MILKKFEKDYKRREILVIAEDIEGNELLSILLEKSRRVAKLSYQYDDGIAKAEIQFRKKKDFFRKFKELKNNI